MLQNIAPQGGAGSDLLADGADHVEERPVDCHDQLFAPDYATVVCGDPDTSNSIGLHIQLCVGVICQTTTNLEVSKTASDAGQCDVL